MTTSDFFTFGVVLQNTSVGNDSFQIVAGTAPDIAVAYADPAATLAAGDTLGDIPGVNVAEVSELVGYEGGALAQLVVTGGSGTAALSISCSSSDEDIAESFSFDVTSGTVGSVTPMDVPPLHGVDTDREVIYTCRDQFGAAHSFTLLVRNVNGNDNFAIVARLLARRDEVGLLLDPGKMLGEELGVDVIQIDEHQGALEDVVALRVTEEPANGNFNITCKSSDAALMGDFSVEVKSTTAGSVIPFPLPKPGEADAEDVFLTYICSPEAKDQTGVGAPWTTTDVHHFKIRIKNVNNNPNFNMVAATGLTRLDGSGVPAGTDLVDYDEGNSRIFIDENQASPGTFGQVVVVNTLAIDVTLSCSGDILVAGVLPIVDIPITAALPVGGTTDFAIPTGDVDEETEVVFTCSPSTSSGVWSIFDVHRFKVVIKPRVTNDAFTIFIDDGANPPREVKTGDDGVDNVPDNSTLSTLELQVKTSPTADVIVECKPSSGTVSTDGNGAALVVTVPSGSATSTQISLGNVTVQNVAREEVVTLICRPQADAGGWTSNDVHVFSVTVDNSQSPITETTATVFSVKAGPDARGPDGTPLGDGTVLNFTNIIAISEGARLVTGRYIKVDPADNTAYTIRCYPDSDAIDPFQFDVPADSSGTSAHTSMIKSEPRDPLTGDKDVTVECMPIGGNPATQRVTFKVRLRKRRFEVVAGSWAFNHSVGRQMTLGTEALSWDDDSSVVVATAGSRLDAGSLAMIRAKSNDFGPNNSIQVACFVFDAALPGFPGDPADDPNYDTSASVGNPLLIDVEDYFEPLGLREPWPDAQSNQVVDRSMANVKCYATATVGDFVQGVDAVFFRIVKRAQRLRPQAGTGAIADLDGSAFTTGSSLEVHEYALNGLPQSELLQRTVTVKQETEYGSGALVELETLLSPGADITISCESDEVRCRDVWGSRICCHILPVYLSANADET